MRDNEWGCLGWLSKTDVFVKFSLYFPRWDFIIFNWILFECEYWEYEQGKEDTENQTVIFFVFEG